MAESSFELKIITPERVFFEGVVDMLEMNTTEGEIGILPGHIPMTVIIKPGVASIYETNGETKEAAIHAGFVEILPDKVTVLAEIAEWPGEIDASRAEAARARAEARLQEKDPSIDMARAEIALLRALARINVIR